MITPSFRRTSVFLFIVALLSLGMLSPDPSQGLVGEEKPQANVDKPFLIVLKETNETKLQIDESIKVTVTLINVGNHSAENIEIEEENFSEWSVDELDYEPSRYVIMESNARFSYEYVIRPNVAGHFLLRPTVVSYTDVNGSEFTAHSNNVEIDVVKEAVELDEGEPWGSYYLLCGLVIVPSLGFIIWLQLSSYLKRRRT